MNSQLHAKPIIWSMFWLFTLTLLLVVQSAGSTRPTIAESGPVTSDANLSTVIIDVIRFLEWKDVIIVTDAYFSTERRHRLTGALSDLYIGSIHLGLLTSSSDVIRSAVSTIQNSTVWSILLMLNSSNTVLLLQQAKTERLLQQNRQWLIVLDNSGQLTTVQNAVCCSLSSLAAVVPIWTSTEQEAFAVCSYNWKTAIFDHVASWTPESRLALLYNGIFHYPFKHFNNTVLRIATWEAPPFTRRISTEPTVMYQGFCLDILNQMATSLNFTYELVEPADGKYGTPEADRTWNGMVGMLVRGELHMAVGPFSITTDRSEVIDFTVPFMEDGGGILTKEGHPVPDLLNVFRPFSLSVWLSMGAAIVVTSVVMFFIKRNYSGQGVEGSRRRPWSFGDCLRVVASSLMSQGAARHPVSLSGRLVLGCWWMFTILIVSIYTASLAALLTVRVLPTHVESIDDLVLSADHTPVTVTGTNWWTQFMTAKTGVYGEVGQKMKLVDVIADGLDMVYQDNAAFISDINQIEYLYGQDCHSLHVATEVFSKLGLAFALPKNSYYREAMNSVILRLQESGILDVWKTKWWKSHPDCRTSHPEGGEPLDLASFRGILLLYAAFVMLGVVSLTARWCLGYCRDQWHMYMFRR